MDFINKLLINLGHEKLGLLIVGKTVDKGS